MRSAKCGITFVIPYSTLVIRMIISTWFERENGHRLEVYQRYGGYEAARKAYTSMSFQQVIEEVKKSQLRGLGGAGFSAGTKWSFIPHPAPKPVYLVVNADEGEPGTFKDRYVLEKAPHLLLEGMMIAAFAIGSHKAYIYIRGEYTFPYERFREAVGEAYRAGLLGSNLFGTNYALEVVIHRGAGAYICGEETALLESLEGKKGFPRLKPPFPAVKGLFGCPTTVNNVETLAYVPSIISNGADAFAKLGSAKQGGLRQFSVSGQVYRPGVYELPVSVTLRDLIYKHGGGMLGGRRLKAVIPGGISAKIMKADEIDVAMDFDSLIAAGTMAGSAGVVAMDETTCMVKALYVASRFFAHESCGQCSPCREGTGWLHKIVTRIYEGKGRREDLENLLKISKNMEGKTICVFADAAAWPIQSYVTKFREEFEYHIEHHRCDVAQKTAESIPAVATHA